MKREDLKKQIEITKKSLEPESEMHNALIQFTELIEMFFEYIEEKSKKL